MPLELGGEIFELVNISLSLDNGKTLTMRQLGAGNYADNIYDLEDAFELNMNLGFGNEQFFSGRVKKLTHIGDVDSESVEYEVWGVPNLADEVEIIGYYGDGYYVGDFRTDFAIELEPGNVVPGILYEPRYLKDAVEAFFEFMEADLLSAGIPIAYDSSTIGEDILVDATYKISGGFFSALKNLVAVDPGVKVWFDDTDETWKFPRLDTLPILDIEVSESHLQAHNWEEDSTDRFTAVQLHGAYSGGLLSFPALDANIVPYWTSTDQANWDITVNSKISPDIDVRSLTGPQKVFRVYAFTDALIGIRTGLKCVLGYKGIDHNYNYVRAEIQGPQVGLNPQPHSLVIAEVPLLSGAGNPRIAGDAQGPLVADAEPPVFCVYNVPLPVGGTPSVRYPATGYSGQVYDRYGIERLKVISVGQHEVTLANAQSQHKLYSDIRMSCSVPVYGDPIRTLMKSLSGKLNLTDVNAETGLESSGGLIIGYAYDFINDTGTLEVSSDLDNFINNLGK